MLINYCKRIEDATTKEERVLLDHRDARFGMARVEITDSPILPALLSFERAEQEITHRATYFYWWFVPSSFQEEEGIWEPSGYASAHFLGTIGRRVELLEQSGPVSWKMHLLHMIHTLCPKLAYAPSPRFIDLNAPHRMGNDAEIMLTWITGEQSLNIILSREHEGSRRWSVTYIDPDGLLATLFTPDLHPWNPQIMNVTLYEHSAHFNRTRLAYMAFYDRGPVSLQISLDG